MPARYIGRERASEEDREMIVLSRSKNAASIPKMVEDAADVSGRRNEGGGGRPRRGPHRGAPAPPPPRGGLRAPRPERLLAGEVPPHAPTLERAARAAGPGPR